VKEMNIHHQDTKNTKQVINLLMPAFLCDSVVNAIAYNNED